MQIMAFALHSTTCQPAFAISLDDIGQDTCEFSIELTGYDIL